MESGEIPDAQVTASSEFNDINLKAFKGRLNKGHSWSAGSNNVNEWLQIDLGDQHPTVTRIATQGRGSLDQWVKEYKLEFSDDEVTFQYYKEQGQTTDKVESTKSLLIRSPRCILI